MIRGHRLGQEYVECVDFLDARVPQEKRASIGGDSVITPEAARI